MGRRQWRGRWLAGLMICLVSMLGWATMGWAQTQQNPPQSSQKQEEIPDAPSAVRPPQPLPPPPAATAPETASPPAHKAPPLTDPTAPIPGFPDNATQPPPPFSIKTVPRGAATPDKTDANDELFKITRNVNQVMVPVRVTGDAGRIVDGLLDKDFAVYEDGKKQTLNFFTSDPFALSAAVIIDLGMPDAAVQKVNQTFSALEGAFSQYDEVAVYTYSNTAGRLLDFNAVGNKLTGALDQLKYVQGRNNGPPILGGPLGPQGPTVNGIPLDPNVPHVMTPAQESHVLNDAILAAALDLSRRDKARRKIIFVISDGRELHSTASYRDVLKVLLTNGIAVYGIGVGGAAIPGYGKLQQLHLPRAGYGDILPRYASATAGQYFAEMSRDAIETAYAQTIGDARNQYTLGYTTRATPSEAYRHIEVTVDLPGLSVYAKDGYYQAPPGH